MSSNSRRSPSPGRPRNPYASSEDEERQRSASPNSRRSPPAAQSRSPEARSPEEEEQRRQYREYLGIDPSQSWSKDYSVSTQEEMMESRGKRSPKSEKGAPFRRVKIDLDAVGNYVLDDSSKSKLRQSPDDCKKARLEKWKLERMEDSTDKQCSVCLETVLQKPQAFDRKFGLLPNCPHVLCLGCAYQWKWTTRKKDDGHQCPTCRTPFDKIIPCKFYVKCKNQKQRILDIMEERAKERRHQELEQDIGRRDGDMTIRGSRSSSWNSSVRDPGSVSSVFYPNIRHDFRRSDYDYRYLAGLDSYASDSSNDYRYRYINQIRPPYLDDDFDFHVYSSDTDEFYVYDEDNDYQSDSY